MKVKKKRKLYNLSAIPFNRSAMGRKTKRLRYNEKKYFQNNKISFEPNTGTGELF